MINNDVPRLLSLFFPLVDSRSKELPVLGWTQNGLLSKWLILVETFSSKRGYVYWNMMSLGMCSRVCLFFGAYKWESIMSVSMAVDKQYDEWSCCQCLTAAIALPIASLRSSHFFEGSRVGDFSHSDLSEAWMPSSGIIASTFSQFSGSVKTSWESNTILGKCCPMISYERL